MESILSVGIDLGTSTTQMVLSRLQVENTAAAFSVPHMEIVEREVLYRSEIHFTPLLSADTIDGLGVRSIIAAEYEKAGIKPSDVQTGAVIITGETARKENARQVLSALAEFAGDFVVTTAGPALESILAARGAGADRAARKKRRYVLHMDIGGGTSNLALFDPEGQLVDTGCLNVGGRLMKFDEEGRPTYISPVLKGMDTSDPQNLARELAEVLEQAAGLRPRDNRLENLITDKMVTLPQEPVLVSFSGGVADLIDKEETDWLRYGDLGVLLGSAIAKSKLCAKAYLLGQETIRATVIGAGSHTTELSGSTISYLGIEFPLQNLPVVHLHQVSHEEIREKLSIYGEEGAALFLEGEQNPSFRQIAQMAETIADAVQPLSWPLVVAVEQDMAKALGQALQLRLGKEVPLICIDRIHIPPGSYLDIAAPVAGGAAVPVIIKTLAFE